MRKSAPIGRAESSAWLLSLTLLLFGALLIFPQQGNVGAWRQTAILIVLMTPLIPVAIGRLRLSDLGLRPLGLGPFIGWSFIAAITTLVATASLSAGLRATGLIEPGSGSGLPTEPLTWAELALALTSAALGEELFYRGFLIFTIATIVGGRAGLAAAVIVQAVVFAVSHLDNSAGYMLLRGGTGLIWGLLYVVSGRSLAPIVVAHLISNTVALALAGRLPS